jgi:UDP-N-acetylglucosamine 2-epimerase
MKILTIVGARPQFIKAALASRELRKDHTEILVHTGQHYDQDMSDIFFSQLGIPDPDYNLGIGSASHGKQTGEMLAAVEKVLLDENPDWVVVYGDTNSTLAGAIAASKLHIKVAHVEAGLRSFNRDMPEEINRVLTDHISDLLLCPSQIAVDNLAKEGITKGVHIVGDVMHDALLWALANNPQNPEKLLASYLLHKKGYLLLTIHRAENTDDPQRLASILDALDSLKEKILWPIHPRTRKKLSEYRLSISQNINIIDPVGYFDILLLMQNARKILTDSGGMQKEAYWLQVPCITLRDETEWVETLQVGWNVLAGVSSDKIIDVVKNWQPPEGHPAIYGDGTAVQKIITLLSELGE